MKSCQLIHYTKTYTTHHISFTLNWSVLGLLFLILVIPLELIAAPELEDKYMDLKEQGYMVDLKEFPEGGVLSYREKNYSNLNGRAYDIDGRLIVCRHLATAFVAGVFDKDDQYSFECIDTIEKLGSFSKIPSDKLYIQDFQSKIACTGLFFDKKNFGLSLKKAIRHQLKQNMFRKNYFFFQTSMEWLYRYSYLIMTITFN